MLKPFFLSVFSLLLLSFSTIGQSGRPQIGLVLSGGGAKGFAHIGVLKQLEAAGIRPDFITGTSMGSIVGALYAIGYSPEEIEAIAAEIDWDEALSNKVPLNRVAIEEKAYYSRYITDFIIDSNGISLPSGAIEGQSLEIILANLTQHVHHIRDFDNFPIPFKCVATDIETGKPVVIDHGNLVSALRASMAIPTVFSPVERDGLLLVDGGLVRNFPVQEVIDMGADRVIGVYVGAHLKDRSELRSMFSILSQSAFLMGIYDAENYIDDCDIFIEPELGDYSASEFNENRIISHLGFEAALPHIPRLKQLAREVNGIDSIAVSADSIAVYAPQRIFTLSSVTIEGAERSGTRYVLGKLQLHKGDQLTLEKLNKRMKILSGTQTFEKVSFNLLMRDSLHRDLVVQVKETSPLKLRTALHYDSETRMGLTLNFTSRNKLINRSRLIAELDIAEYPKGEVSLLKYIGKPQFWALIARVKGEVEQEILTSNAEGEESTFRLFRGTAYGGIQSTFSRNFTVGGVVFNERGTVRPRINQDSIINEITHSSWGVNGFITYNSLNDPFFPTRGFRINAQLKYLTDIQQQVTVNYPFEVLENDIQTSFDVVPYALGTIAMEWAIPINSSLTWTGSADMGLATTRETAISDFFFIGGVQPKVSHGVGMFGLELSRLFTNDFFKVRTGVRLNPIERFYVEAQVDYLNIHHPFNEIEVNIAEPLDVGSSRTNTYLEYKGKLFHATYGWMISASYMSFIGPIKLGLTGWERSKTIRPYISVGYRF